MTVPGWYALLLLGAAAYRTWRLLAEDTILHRSRERGIFLIRKRWGRTADKARELIECPWCSGFWIALGWWGGFEMWPHGTVIVAVPLALSALVGAIGSATPD